MMNEHTSKVYEHELSTLREKLVLMGSLAEEMTLKGIEAHDSRDSELAKNTLKIDRRINRLECEVDELCMRILAMRQPVASDLRFITTALKIVTDLERIGDLGVNICERVMELNDEPPLPPIPELNALADDAIGTVREAIDALVARDVERATELLARDDIIDERYARLFTHLLQMMSEDPSIIFRATRVQSIAKYLERIADHAMNIAEDVVFLVRGKDIRHPNKRGDSEVPGGPPRKKAAG
ncbi:MAG: phosphate signaling complex protein PhoU [Polyangiaceae bacterium]